MTDSKPTPKYIKHKKPDQTDVPRIIQISVRFREEEAANLQANAHALGVSMADLIRKGAKRWLV